MCCPPPALFPPRRGTCSGRRPPSSWPRPYSLLSCFVPSSLSRTHRLTAALLPASSSSSSSHPSGRTPTPRLILRGLKGDCHPQPSSALRWQPACPKHPADLWSPTDGGEGGRRKGRGRPDRHPAGQTQCRSVPATCLSPLGAAEPALGMQMEPAAGCHPSPPPLSPPCSPSEPAWALAAYARAYEDLAGEACGQRGGGGG